MTLINGTVRAGGYGGIETRPTIATVKFSMEAWPTTSPNLELIPPDDKIAIGWKNLLTFGGIPPYDFVENYIPVPGQDLPSVSPADYGKGGIRLTLTIGEDDFELVGTVQRPVLMYIQYNNGRNLGISEWSFTIVDKGDAAALGAVGSTMEGVLVSHNSNHIVKSTGGTGLFENAKLTGKTTTTAYPVIGMSIVFTVTVGWGTLVLTP